MAAITPIRESDIEFDNGSFDSAAFAARALSSWQELAAVIDHTLLKPDATREQVRNLCDEAIRYRFACAMVNPIWASTAAGVLSGTGTVSAGGCQKISLAGSFAEIPDCACGEAGVRP